MMATDKKPGNKQLYGDLSETIRSLHTKLGLTQEQFAAKVGVTVSTVNRWENGKGKPSPLAMRQTEELLSGNSGN